MKTLLIGILLLLVVSCKSEKEEFIQKIAGDDFKYWDCKGRMKDGKKQLLKRPNICLKFSRNGEFKEFIYHTRKSMYDMHEGSDNVVENKWKYLRKNVIKLNYGTAEITFLNEDSLAYRSSEFVYFFTPTKKRPKIVDESEVFTISIIETP